MLVLEFKIYEKSSQFSAVDESIWTARFVRNKALQFWIDNLKSNKYDLNKYCAVLAKEFPFANELNAQARQSSAERAWSAIARFFETRKKGIPGKKGVRSSKKAAVLSNIK